MLFDKWSSVSQSPLVFGAGLQSDPVQFANLWGKKQSSITLCVRTERGEVGGL